MKDKGIDPTTPDGALAAGKLRVDAFTKAGHWDAAQAASTNMVNTQSGVLKAQTADRSTAANNIVLASLFHVAYIYAYRVKGFDRLLIEVNPRHVKYYEKILGFKVMGPQRMNLRVNAPAVLLCLSFSHTEQQIGKFGGQPQMSATERSLYPYSFSVDEATARPMTPANTTTVST